MQSIQGFTLNTAKVARRLKTTKRHVLYLTVAPIDPLPAIKIGTRKYYHPLEVEDWAARQSESRIKGYKHTNPRTQRMGNRPTNWWERIINFFRR